jgi:hypothetical protein
VAGVSLLVASSAWLAGCSFSDSADNYVSGMNSRMEAAPTHGQTGAHLPGPPQPGNQSNALMVTPRQRAYLDQLHAAGVRPSNDLTALSIGSSVCQARAAKQTEQAVWDFVAPLVRNDAGQPVGDSGAAAPSSVELHDETANYIRIATDRLC